MNNTTFTALLEAFTRGEASPAEFALLMDCIKSGEYDSLLKNYIDRAMLTTDSRVDMDDARAREVLQRILYSEKQTAKLLPDAVPALRRRRWYRAAAAVVMAVAVGLTGYFMRYENTTVPGKAAEKLQVLSKADHTREKKYLHLQDGSTVLLNEGSSIHVPESFGRRTREVVLVGEGYFDIKHDAAKPFIVHTGTVSTTVLGTAFNIRAYPGQHEVVVTVTRGRVKVSNEKKDIGTITPNESMAVNIDSKSFRQETVNSENVLEWKKQFLVLDDISMEDAATLIANKYHVTISFSKEALRHCHLSATFLNNESLEQVLQVVAGVVNADFSVQPNDQVIISGEGCK